MPCKQWSTLRQSIFKWFGQRNIFKLNQYILLPVTPMRLPTSPNIINIYTYLHKTHCYQLNIEIQDLNGAMKSDTIR